LVARMAQNSGGRKRSKLMVHADDAGSYVIRLTLEFVKHHRMKKAPHSRYSPRLALSNCYLLSLRLHQATHGRTRIPWSGSTSRGSQTHSGGNWDSSLRSDLSRLNGETRAMR
jgi:hypothetical protein